LSRLRVIAGAIVVVSVSFCWVEGQFLTDVHSAPSLKQQGGWELV
jgi:hypothetical protein